MLSRDALIIILLFCVSSLCEAGEGWRPTPWWREPVWPAELETRLKMMRDEELVNLVQKDLRELCRRRYVAYKSDAQGWGEVERALSERRDVARQLVLRQVSSALPTLRAAAQTWSDAELEERKAVRKDDTMTIPSHEIYPLGVFSDCIAALLVGGFDIETKESILKCVKILETSEKGSPEYKGARSLLEFANISAANEDVVIRLLSEKRARDVRTGLVNAIWSSRHYSEPIRRIVSDFVRNEDEDLSIRSFAARLGRDMGYDQETLSYWRNVLAERHRPHPLLSYAIAALAPLDVLGKAPKGHAPPDNDTLDRIREWLGNTGKEYMDKQILLTICAYAEGTRYLGEVLEAMASKFPDVREAGREAAFRIGSIEMKNRILRNRNEDKWQNAAQQVVELADPTASKRRPFTDVSDKDAKDVPPSISSKEADTKANRETPNTDRNLQVRTNTWLIFTVGFCAGAIWGGMGVWLFLRRRTR